MNTKTSAFAICVEAIIYLLLYNLHDCTFNFSVEDHCVDIFYWFDKTSKQKSILKDFYNFCDHDYHEAMKYISSYWLCAECCSNRKLKKHTGLRSYFLTESEKDKRFFRLNKAFSKNRQHSIWYSLQAILPTFTNFHKLLQTEEPLIQCLHGETQPFMNKLASKFLKSEIMHKLKDCNLS